MKVEIAVFSRAGIQRGQQIHPLALRAAVRRLPQRVGHRNALQIKMQRLQHRAQQVGECCVTQSGWEAGIHRQHALQIVKNLRLIVSDMGQSAL